MALKASENTSFFVSRNSGMRFAVHPERGESWREKVAQLYGGNAPISKRAMRNGKASLMINATEVHKIYEEETPANYWSVLKRRVRESPLTALGVAAGAGFLAYGLLKPKQKRRRNYIGRAVNAVSGGGRRSRAERALKSVIGSLALRYLSRKLNSKLRWR